MRRGKDHVEVRAVEQLGSPIVQPTFSRQERTLRTDPMPTGVIRDPMLMSVRATNNMPAHALGSTIAQTNRRPPHITREPILLAELLEVIL